MKRLIKKIGIGVSLSVLIFTCVACGKTNTNDSNINDSQKEIKIKLDKENAISVNYDNKDYEDILHLFKTNEVQAKDKYLKKTLKITGEVTKISETGETIIVSIMTKNKFYGAKLEFENVKANKDKLMNLKVYDDSQGRHNEVRGDIITVYGVFNEYKDGATVNDGDRINIKYCELVE